jgi:hypothetical protein
MLFMLLFTACQQGLNPLPEDPDQDDILANAGEIHNKMIAYYYENRVEKTPTMEAMLDEIMGLSFDYLATLGYDAASTTDVKLQLKERYCNSNLKNTDGQGFSIDPATFIAQISATGLYSEHFHKAIDEILKQASLKDDRKVIRKYVNSDFINIQFKRKQDQEAQQLFAKIFNGSYEFWESYEESDLKGVQLKKSSWVIINDGIGGILGSVFGPIGSIVTATVFSVGTNEEINR